MDFVKVEQFMRITYLILLTGLTNFKDSKELREMSKMYIEIDKEIMNARKLPNDRYGY